MLSKTIMLTLSPFKTERIVTEVLTLGLWWRHQTGWALLNSRTFKIMLISMSGLMLLYIVGQSVTHWGQSIRQQGFRDRVLGSKMCYSPFRQQVSIPQKAYVLIWKVKTRMYMPNNPLGAEEQLEEVEVCCRSCLNCALCVRFVNWMHTHKSAISWCSWDRDLRLSYCNLPELMQCAFLLLKKNHCLQQNFEWKKTVELLWFTVTLHTLFK